MTPTIIRNQTNDLYKTDYAKAYTILGTFSYADKDSYNKLFFKLKDME